MSEGLFLLWYDASKKELIEKAREALNRFIEKHQIEADSLRVSLKDYEKWKKEGKINWSTGDTMLGMVISAKATILPNHIMVGTTTKQKRDNTLVLQVVKDREVSEEQKGQNLTFSKDFIT